jgi:hypothetical protein
MSHNLNDWFEKIFVLNLNYKPDRRERLERHLRDLNLARAISWVPACSGDMMPAPAWWRAGNGAWGCLLSHARVLQDAIADRLDNYLILEDDAIFQTRSGEMLSNFMPHVPSDWGQIYLGGQHLREPSELPGNPHVLRAWNVNRTHAFAIRSTIFARFHQHIWHAPDYISKDGGWHIDHQLGLAHERADWMVYTPQWWLAGQDRDWSNISGRLNPRLWWHPSRHATKLPFIRIPDENNPENSGELLEYLHPGNTLVQGTYQDVGLGEIGECDTKLRAWLRMIAREALDLHKLPAFQCEGLDIDRVKSVWPAGVFELNSADLPALVDYPWNGLAAYEEESTPSNKSDVI